MKTAAKVSVFLFYDPFLQVDYGSTAKELVDHFHGCGPVVRVTINCDKYSGHPKGLVFLLFLRLPRTSFLPIYFSFAYVEFETKEGMQNALAMDDSLFRGRQIKVSELQTFHVFLTPESLSNKSFQVVAKRTNRPGISTTNRGRARGESRRYFMWSFE